MAIRMGYWDCKACGNKRIPGPERQCVSCGQPRSANVTFYTDDEAPEVDDEAMLARARSGVDWHCPYCSADNPAGTTSCVGCGAATDGKKTRQERVLLDAPPPPAAVAAPTTSRAIPIVAVLLALITGVWFLFFRTTEHTVSVTTKTWSKTIVVERLETQIGEGWSEDVPPTARPIDSTNKRRTIHVQDGTERVKVGQKDLGNGFFEDVYEDKPRMVDKEINATWVRYEIDRWISDRTLEEKSTDGREPPWPSFAAAARTREGGRTNRIELGLAGSDGESYSYGVEPERGTAYEVGKSYVAEINAVGAVRELR